MTKSSEIKALRNEISTLYKLVAPSMSKTMRYKYSAKIETTTHKSTLNSLIRTFNTIKQSIDQSVNHGLKPKVTDKYIQTAKKEKVNIGNRLKAVEQRRNRNIRTRETDAIGSVFNEITINASEINGIADFNPELLSSYNVNNGIAKILINTINRKFLETTKNNKMNGLRTFITFQVRLKKYIADDAGGFFRYKTAFVNSPIRTLHTFHNIGSFVIDSLHKMNEEITNAKDGSEWIFDRFLVFKIKSNVFKLVQGKSYIKLPKAIAAKNAIVNPVNNFDNKCFDWCLLIHKHYDSIAAKDKNLVSYYKKHWDTIKRPENVQYPITEADIQEYAKLNNMQINVFQLLDFDETKDPKNCIDKLYKSDTNKPDVVNLLLIRDGDNTHYTYVRSLNRLFASKTTKHSKHMCPHCVIKGFQSEELLKKHIVKCSTAIVEEEHRLDVEYKCAEEGKNILKFNNFGRKFKHPFHVIADFESTLVKQDVDESMATQKYQKHMQNSFGLKYCSIHKEHDRDVEILTHTDPEEVSKQFILRLEELAKQSYKLLQTHKEDINDLTEAQLEEHEKATKCVECDCAFVKKSKNSNNKYKVVHHDHITGNYISTICSECNLQMTYKPFLPVYIHNLKGYDAHLFVNSLHKYGDTTCELSCIPNNEERYISFSKKIKVGEEYINKTGVIRPITFEIRFLDSIAFMNSGIASLVDNLVSGCKTIDDFKKTFPNTSKHFKKDFELRLMTSKGIYPYDYIDSYDKLLETKLPEQKEFYSQLYQSGCSDSDYLQAQLVWKAFNCKTFLDYHCLYLKSDVLLLADVWENFRNTCYTNYELDCTYYYTSPGLSYDAMLKFTKIELELFTDLNMYTFCEGGIRGGLSQISTRYAKANNKYMTAKPKENTFNDKDKSITYYDETKESSYIIYLDANNLYGHAMSQYLPYKGFKWNNDEWNTDMITAISDTSSTGYKFKVDLHIPVELHDHFNNYVPCPENVMVKKSNLNQWQQDEYTESKITKLCTSFEDKLDYIVDYRYLKLVLSLGVKLIKVHQVLEYEQKPFLKDYIELNTNLRKKAKNDFEKDFFKLMNNSVFGKTMENVRNRINFRLITNEAEAWRVKNLSKFTIFSDSLVGVHIQKQKIQLTKPVYLGQTILDDSKALMYDFHYNFMLKKIPDRNDIDLLFTDTDSLCYAIRKHDIFEIMKNNKDYFDLSDYPEDHELHDPTNKKVIGKFKNESIEQITEFVGLRAKLYAYSVDRCAKKELKLTDAKQLKEKTMSLLTNVMNDYKNESSVNKYIDLKNDYNKIAEIIHKNKDEKHLKAKGVKKCVAKNDLNIQMYKDVLFNRTTKSVKQNGIRSYGHQLYTESVTKVALSGRDDKVYICDDDINTYNFGHYKTKMM